MGSDVLRVDIYQEITQVASHVVVLTTCSEIVQKED